MINRDLKLGRHVVFKFCKHLINSKPLKILDIAAGGGSDLTTCKKLFKGSELIAYDSYPPNVIKLGQSGFRTNQINLEKDLFPEDDNSLDLIIANQTLEHCKELFWIFDQMSRKLRIGGHILIGVPNLASAHNRLALLFGMQPTCIRNYGSHVRGFTPEDVKKFISIISPDLYSIELYEGSNFYPFPPFIANTLAKLFPNLSVSIFFLLKKNRNYNSEFLHYPLEQKLETNFWTGSPIEHLEAKV